MIFNRSSKYIVVHTRTHRYALYSKPPKQYNAAEAMIVEDCEHVPMMFMVYLSTDVYIGDKEVEWHSLYEELPSPSEDDILAEINSVIIRHTFQTRVTTSIAVVFNSSNTAVLLYKGQILPRIKAPETVDKFFEGIGFKELKLYTAQILTDIPKNEETIVYVGRVDSFSNAILDSNYGWYNIHEKVTKRYDAFLLYTLNLIEYYARQEFTLLITEPSGRILVHDSALPVTNNVLEALDTILLSACPKFELRCVAHGYWIIACSKEYKTTTSRYRWVELSSIKDEVALSLLSSDKGDSTAVT